MVLVKIYHCICESTHLVSNVVYIASKMIYIMGNLTSRKCYDLLKTKYFLPTPSMHKLDDELIETSAALNRSTKASMYLSKGFYHKSIIPVQ